LVLADGGRKLAYNRLKAEDARAEYPVRIDPTFSDANWVSFGGVPGVDGEVEAAVVDNSGNLYIGGSFTVVGNVIATNIARWNGSSWSALGTGLNSFVDALAVSGTNLYAGGFFNKAGGVTANDVAQWNGSSWSALGSGIVGQVYALAVSGTTLYVGGEFLEVDGVGGVPANYIAQWNGSSWSALGSGMNGPVDALAVSGTTLYAGGFFQIAGSSSAYWIAQWNGSSWSAVGGGLNFPVSALAVSGSTLYVGGGFTTATNSGGATVTVNYIAQWNGSTWSALGAGMNNSVNALAVSGNNNLYAGGDFATAGTNVSAYVAEALFSPSSYNLALTTAGAGTYVITGLGTPNYAYALDLATNLAPPIDWMPQATNTQPGVNLIFTNASAWPEGFYRTRYVPQ
jgi:hypothetical protein